MLGNNHERLRHFEIFRPPKSDKERAGQVKQILQDFTDALAEDGLLFPPEIVVAEYKDRGGARCIVYYNIWDNRYCMVRACSGPENNESARMLLFSAYIKYGERTLRRIKEFADRLDKENSPDMGLIEN